MRLKLRSRDCRLGKEEPIFGGREPWRRLSWRSRCCKYFRSQRWSKERFPCSDREGREREMTLFCSSQLTPVHEQGEEGSDMDQWSRELEGSFRLFLKLSREDMSGLVLIGVAIVVHSNIWKYRRRRRRRRTGELNSLLVRECIII